MKRTVPLLIAAHGRHRADRLALHPRAESWGEVAAIWFDILAAVAFVLGGGSLFKLQLRRSATERPAGDMRPSR